MGNEFGVRGVFISPYFLRFYDVLKRDVFCTDAAMDVFAYFNFAVVWDLRVRLYVGIDCVEILSRAHSVIGSKSQALSLRSQFVSESGCAMRGNIPCRFV